MTVHIVRRAFGADTLDDLKARQKMRMEEAKAAGGKAVLRSMTRAVPRRADEVTDGGSIYWIIKGHIRARQKIKRIERIDNPNSRRKCSIVLDPKLIETVPQPRKARRGWAYLEENEVPPDMPKTKGAKGDSLPPELAAELRELGLL